MAYIGVSPSNGVRRKHTYTATAAQTDFTGAGAEGITLRYLDSNYIDVYQNGVKLSEADYTSTSGDTIVLAETTVSDIIEIVVYDVFSVADTVSKSAGGTFDGNVTAAGTITVTGNADLNGELDVAGTTNLDAVDVDGAVNFAADVTFATGADIITGAAGASTVRIGLNTGDSVTSSGIKNTLVGDTSGTALTDGNRNTAVGFESLQSDTKGSRSIAVGHQALNQQNFTSATNTYNTAVGHNAGGAVTTGVNNTLLGGLAGDAISDSDGNTALGYGALGAEQQGNKSTAVGWQALLQANRGSSGDSFNVAVGYNAGSGINTGVKNTFIGGGSGSAVTSGDENTILGAYNGNNGGLDIRTGSNRIVLSDGDGNPRMFCDASGNWVTNGTAASGRFAIYEDLDAQVMMGLKNINSSNTNGTFIRFRNAVNAQIGAISQSGSANATTYATSSDYRIKENVNYTFDATTELKKLKPAKFNFIGSSDIVEGFLAHEVQDVIPLAVTGTKDEMETAKDVVLNSDGTVLDDGVTNENWLVGKEDGLYASNTSWVETKEVPKIQGLDQSKLVPLLTKAIQELSAKNDALEARIKTLEG